MTERVINIFSPNWVIQDSYGRLALELKAGFEAKGYHVNPFGDNAPATVLQPAWGGLYLGYPTLYKDFERQILFAEFGKRVAITMFESTKLPDGWAENLNRCDAVIVPSSFLIPIFRKNGVKAPLHVHPLGVSKEFFKPRLRTLSEERPLTFLAIADRGLRKGWDKAAFAFEAAFGKDMRYKLILKSREKTIEINQPNIQQIAHDMSNNQLAKLYRRCDVMVFPSCGEGFGLPPREFAATGGISLATNWGGTQDALNLWGVSLPANLTTAWRDNKEWYGRQGQWAEVDQDELVAKLLRVAGYFEYFAKEAHEKAAPFVARNYQWSRFTENIETIWKQVNEPKKVVEVEYASAG
jgi:glycosyltransferase involved in cell wall biosynthesis